jgi:hypothetical protein
MSVTERWVDRMADESEAAKAHGAAGKPESPEAFLTGLGKTLREKEGVDAGLADILATHLLTAAPAKDAVAQAKDGIIKLARERATPPKTEADSG